ncbi:glycosyltransferase family 2 protein [Piscinibacter gummiphilus]|uniref:Succinoglycan biosynthesis protein exoa n=1 Tax=Piscinibacter gummiphilus TaxID=946333 RepID=A0A1W6LEI9_9BURK|nr:glycosyltransferase family 2 protein [Piscinibacter gummiphilus]ARN22588.1 succinoglycan biosynthesis protein exoa [Piscinibacter gummiphilus]ATU67287.1 glycosyltransferase family 2 protein [Piscinibacter gummiphilus]GLS97626.1 succinoglycan biosynthesis protein exoa [Piscinibacter gummiphilus]
MTRSILVVIPTLNEARTIDGVLSALSKDLPAGCTTTFVVADGGSTDGTAERVSSWPGVQLLRNPRRIQSAAVNLAARTHGGDADVLIRCDAHAVYPPGFVRQLVESLDRNGADAVVVPMDSVGHSCLQKATAWVSDTPVGSGGSAHRGGRRSGFVDHGHHAAFRMASFRRAGGYDETFTHNEDAELDCRQRALGSKVWLDADIRLEYHPRDTFTGLWKQYRGYGRGRSRTVRRHPGSMRARQLAVPVHLALSAAALVLAAWAPWLLVWPAAYLAALAAVSVALAVKHRSACGLLGGPAAFVMHTAWAMGFFGGLLSLRETPWRPGMATPGAEGLA